MELAPRMSSGRHGKKNEAIAMRLQAFGFLEGAKPEHLTSKRLKVADGARKPFVIGQQIDTADPLMSHGDRFALQKMVCRVAPTRVGFGEKLLPLDETVPGSEGLRSPND
ncbi:hypothetical protein KSX_93440 [Ktedonospora formicarum]|uniref:Uncharacterized protein n=1 Tax=Ktedonospora formicarum TaxID=2778364 RepID=A0A8J3IBY6_9CHLR|nr:hypothetical protein KSX_93440 [Ktedonospora formicarum]